MSRPRSVVVVTGSELVRGDRNDLNGPFLAHELLRLGLEPARISIVGDRADELAAALQQGLEADLCLISGGLGPTHDDRTVEVLAHVARRELSVDPRLQEQIAAVSRTIAERYGRPFAEFEPGVRKQATLPDGAVSLGLAGTAPGLVLEWDGRVAVALPGPPAELRRLWPRAVESAPFQRLLARTRPPDHRVLRFYGVSESMVAHALREAGGDGAGVEATVCARELEIHVDLFASRGAERRATELAEALEARLQPFVFAQDERPVEELVLSLARARGLTLGTAESCTGGLVAARLTSVPGASDVFRGAVVAYDDDVKVSELAVPRELLARHGAVSAETAEAMAEGARTRLAVDRAVAVTGIAGPSGGTAEKPVGLVHLHVVGGGAGQALRLTLHGDRDTIRRRAAVAALHLVRRFLAQS